MLAARTITFVQSAIIALLLLMAGCESMPVQEMSDARQAIMAARDAGAADHAAAQLVAAEDSLASAEAYLNSRNYGSARREAIQAKSKAMDALRISEAAKDKDN